LAIPNVEIAGTAFGASEGATLMAPTARQPFGWRAKGESGVPDSTSHFGSAPHDYPLNDYEIRKQPLQLENW